MIAVCAQPLAVAPNCGVWAGFGVVVATGVRTAPNFNILINILPHLKREGMLYTALPHRTTPLLGIMEGKPFLNA
jgi:hypothetical protein